MDNTIFRTENDNIYLFSFNQKHTILSHPILTYFVYKNIIQKDTVDIKSILQLDTINIENKVYSKKEVSHYYNKFLFLLEQNFFEEITPKYILSGKINTNEIENQLQSINTVVFEVTERCNLSCKYCVFKEHYNMHSDRKYNDLDIDIAKKTLDYLTLKWISKKENSYKELVVGFYGGEPLLQFETIKTIIEYTKSITKETGLRFKFIMTTNGVLLDKYIDELIQNNFLLTISLDGNKKNNSYRLFPDNTPSFDIVYKNIQLIKKKNPLYFQKSVSFNSVLHDLNTETEVKEYFINEFTKHTSTNFIRNADKVEENTFIPSNEIKIDYINDNNIEDFFNSNNSFSHLRFIKSYNRNIFHHLNEIERNEWDTQKYFPTSVCFPFTKKLYITTQGKILPCERINYSYDFGYIDKKGINLNANSIAEKYNKYFENANSICTNCFNFFNCPSCLFLDVITIDGSVKCENFIDRKTHSSYLSRNWSFLEKNSFIYSEITKRINYE